LILIVNLLVNKMENIKNNLQLKLYNFLYNNKSKSFTPEFLHLKEFNNYSIRQIKYNLTKLTKKNIGIEEEYICIKDSGYIYSNGYYKK